MNKLAALLLLFVCSLFGQSAETVFFRAILQPANEVPAVNISASGWATLEAHILRDSTGQIVSGSVDFLVGYSFPSQVTITGLHIHNGPAGVNAGVVISSGLSGTNNVVSDASGRGIINLQGEVMPGDTAGLAALAGILQDPSQYYVNLHTTDNPAGVMRGQMQKATAKLLMGLMSPLNEIPAITAVSASGIARVAVITTWDPSGQPTSGQLLFYVDYHFPSQVTFTGFHIHNGPAGVNAGVIFNTGIGSGAASLQSDPSGVGSINRPVEVDITNSAQRTSLLGLWSNPMGYYINLHTTEYPAGVIRAQLRNTDHMTFPVNLQPSNETPPVTGTTASAVGVLQVSTLRYEDGTVEAGAVTFDMNYRFPGPATITGMHIHDGAAGVAGPVRIDSGLSGSSPLNSATGFGNIFRTVTAVSDAALNTLNTIVHSPENTYVNIHTSDHPAGVVRSQLGPANTDPPTVTAVISGNLDKNASTLAPGELISIFGSNLAKVTTDLAGWQGTTIPEILNGAAVAVGGVRAKMLYVSPTQINAQVAFETPTGDQLLSVNNDNAPSAPLPVTLAPAAPALFFTSSGALAVRNSDGALIGPDTPAHPGDMITLYLTGAGQTNPALKTGQLVPAIVATPVLPVSVTIGGQPATVVSAAAVPGYVGLYQVVVTVPAVSAGNANTVVTVGTFASDSVTLAVAGS
ncbi:MAG TPA: CHRD domain-containing protein [Bryobacteraceae bacterium]|nr:CHRD domain-containing protein [Bryobacteraceae bacterium]